MILVQGFMRVQPDDFAKYRRRIALHVARVQLLDGCLQYSISEDPGMPGLLWVAERWQDMDAQAAHMAGDHMAEFNMFMKHMPVSAAHIASYEVAGPGQWLMRVGNPAID